MVDGIARWWRENQARLAGTKRLVVNLDNGPECSGHRRQFLRRLVAFADRDGSLPELIRNYAIGTAEKTTETRWTQRETSVCLRPGQSPFSLASAGAQDACLETTDRH